MVMKENSHQKGRGFFQVRVSQRGSRRAGARGRWGTEKRLEGILCIFKMGETWHVYMLVGGSQ